MAFFTGLRGTNWLSGTTGNDIMLGNDGFDFLNGQEGNDILAGFQGNDELRASYGNDILLGGRGNDIMDGAAGKDLMIGGGGNDVYYWDNPQDRIVEFAFGGTDEVRSWISATLPGQVENLTLLDGAANGTGNTLDNALVGNSADNVLSGLQGADHLQGGAGNDTLIGGTGRDTLHGGTGADLFSFARGSGRDVIADFSIADGDRIGIDAGMSYAVRADRAGNALISFSGSDDVTLLGVSASAVNRALFAVG